MLISFTEYAKTLPEEIRKGTLTKLIAELNNLNS